MALQNSSTGEKNGAKPLDQIDLHILHLLVADPRRSQRSLAKEVGLSPSAVSERINQLEERGVITGYTTTVDLSKLGLPISVYIGISCELGIDHVAQSRQLTEIPEVESVVLTTGEFDLLLKINVCDMTHLNEVLFTKLIEGGRGLSRSHSMVSLKEFKQADYVSKMVERLMD